MPDNDLKNDIKTDKFLSAIQKFAEEQKSQVLSEAEEFKIQEIKKAEDEGLKEAFELIQHEMASMRSNISKTNSKKAMEGKKKLFARRTEITSEVFEKAEKKLNDFTKTPDYKKYIITSAKNIFDTLKSDDVVIYVKSDDMKYAKDIITVFNNKCDVKESNTITIGGLKGHSANLGLVADETLDTKLESQREWFTANCGISVI